MNFIVGEARERLLAGVEDHLDIANAGARGYLLGRNEQLLATLAGKKGAIDHSSALPTFMSRKRETLAPCPVPITCSGCPLPQFGTPHRVQCSGPAIASQL